MFGLESVMLLQDIVSLRREEKGEKLFSSCNTDYGQLQTNARYVTDVSTDTWVIFGTAIIVHRKGNSLLKTRYLSATMQLV